jgi:hypothetical protein
MRKKLLSLVLIGAIALLLGLSTPVAAGGPPIQPMAFWGTVLVDGAPAPGSTVSAHIDGLSWTTPVDGDSHYGYSPTFFKIPHDDPETPAKDGGVDGDLIIFKVDGVPAIETYYYELGQAVPLDLHVGVPPEEPYIGFYPTSFMFDAMEGGVNPPSQTLEIWNAGGGTLNWSVGDDAVWLSLDPTSGSSTGETDNVTVSVDITGMTAGSYPAIITITGNADNSPQYVDVTLDISPPAAPYIGFSPASFTFSATEGGANPSDKTLEIWNDGGGTLNWAVSPSALWLDLDPTSGSSTGEIDDVDVSVDITGMMHEFSPYVATITITGNADNSPQYVDVTVNIKAPAPPPVGGTAYIPTKPSILGPWIGLLALAVGLGIFGWRRRRARQRSIG